MNGEGDADFVRSITPDVMKSLERSGFFTKLDDLLCPVDAAAVTRCSGSYTLAESILRDSGYDSEDLADIWYVMQSLGGCCDCEIIYNVAESSRLKAKYWQDRAHQKKH